MTDVQTQADVVKTPQIASLSDLECSTITVVVTLADDADVSIPVRMIPQHRMMQLSASIPSAVPPLVDYAAGGKPVYNYNDNTFIANASEVAFKRNCLMLAEMIQMDIPGEALEDKAQYIREKFDPLVTEQLIGVINDRREKAKARVVTRAETFHN